MKSNELYSLHLPDCQNPFVIVIQERDENGQEVEVERCVTCGGSQVVRELRKEIGKLNIHYEEYRERSRRRGNGNHGSFIPYRKCKHGVQNFNKNGNIVRCRKCEREKYLAKYHSKFQEGATV